MNSHRSLCIVLLLLNSSLSLAEEKKSTRIDPAGISGSLLLVGGGKTPDSAIDQFVRIAGGENGHLVIIPTASAKADEKDADQKAIERWKAHKFASVTVLHTRDREKANEDDFVAPLKKATAVWIPGGSQSKLTEAYLGTQVEKELYALLKRDGIIGGTSAGAAVMSKVMIASGKEKAELKTGFDLLPGAIVDQHFTQRKRQNRLWDALSRSPGRFGIGIDEDTAVLVRGRRLLVLGKNEANVYLDKDAVHDRTTYSLKGRRFIADLTAMRRAARDRAAEAFPPKKEVAPIVEKGALVIVGGGGMPKPIVDKFIELAGGPDALIVVLPTAVPDSQAARSGRGAEGMFRRAGAKNVKVLPASKLKDVEDPKNLAILKQAKGLWFGGGRQWRFMDAYEGTKAVDLFHDVLKRGGVIGGSSAGASIQGDYLARANPLGNLDIMADGYEKGLNFLPGVAIDQHFRQRNRFKDMTSLVERYPALLGIGIDEATALIVQGHRAEIMGRGEAHFYDRRKPVEEDKPDHESVKAGGVYDLKARKVMPAKDR